MFPKLNPHLISEIKEWDLRLGKIRLTQAEGKAKAASSQAADAGKFVVVDCSL